MRRLKTARQAHQIWVLSSVSSDPVRAHHHKRKPAWIAPPEVCIQDDSVHAVVATGQQLRVLLYSAYPHGQQRISRAAGGNPAVVFAYLRLGERLYWAGMARMLWLSRSWMRRTACIPRSAPACWNRYMKRRWHTNWRRRGLRITRQQAIPVVYESVRIHTGFHADWSWRIRDRGNQALAEHRAGAPEAASHLPEAGRQTPGAAINFNVALIQDGITRIGPTTQRLISREAAKTAKGESKALGNDGHPH